MPKMKTHKGLHKRVRVSARGEVLHKRAFAGHLMSGKSGARRRALRRVARLVQPYADKVKRLIGA